MLAKYGGDYWLQYFWSNLTPAEGIFSEQPTSSGEFSIMIEDRQNATVSGATYNYLTVLVFFGPFQRY